MFFPQSALCSNLSFLTFKNFKVFIKKYLYLPAQ